MGLYDAMYRVGYTPWEHPGPNWVSSFAQRLDLEEAERNKQLGRALDLGCGRGQHAAELARRGWDVVGVDNAGRAVESARGSGIDGATFVVGDVSDLPVDQFDAFDFFLDVGCFQHFDSGQRVGAGRGITALANPGATLLMMEFSRPTPVGSFAKGVSADDVRAAFPAWELLSVEDAETDGMDFPMSRMQPQWFRLRLQS
jgi:SAM-dependent methyltransferase